MDDVKKVFLKFKAGFKLPFQFMDQFGFVYLDGHEKETPAEYAEKLMKTFPKNFSVPEPEPVIEPDNVKEKVEKKAVTDKQTKPAFSKRTK